MHEFRGLRFLGKLYVIIAIFGLVVGTITLCMIAAAAQHDVPFDFGRFGWVLGATFVHFVVFYGLSEAVDLLFELREKSDKGLRLLRKLQPEPEPSADEVVAAEVLGPYYKGRKR